jgi:hypothetical protein
MDDCLFDDITNEYLQALGSPGAEIIHEWFFREFRETRQLASHLSGKHSSSQ